MWRTLVVVAVAALLLGILFSSSPFPPGADPGHMLALSYALEGNGPEGELGYAPAVPAVMLVLRRVTDGDTTFLFWLVKVLGLLCLLAEAGGLAAFAGSIAGRSAAQWTFVLAAWNPNSWNQLLWGGYAQLLAIGLGGCALALLARDRYVLSGVLVGAVVLTHPYSAAFFGVAAAALLLSRRSWRALATVIVSVVVALPSVPTYSHFLGQLSFGRTVEAYAISVAEIAQNIVFHPAINVLMGLLLAFAFVARKQALALLWPFLLACGVLFVVTPPLHVARAGLFAWHGAVLFMGISFASASASRIVLAVVCLIPIVSFAELTTLVAGYAPLKKNHAESMMTLASAANGRALIVSPTPNVDGWWYEGLTGKPALIGDDLRWALLREQQERSVAAQIIEHATHVQNEGPIHFLTLELPGKQNVTSLWVRDVEFFPLIELRRPDGGEIVVTPARGARCDDSEREGDRISVRCEFFYESYRLRGFKRNVEVEAFPTAPSHDLLRQWNVSHVWVRGKREAAERFELDDRFEKAWEQSEVVVFRVRGNNLRSLPTKR